MGTLVTSQHYRDTSRCPLGEKGIATVTIELRSTQNRLGGLPIPYPHSLGVFDATQVLSEVHTDLRTYPPCRASIRSYPSVAMSLRWSPFPSAESVSLRTFCRLASVPPPSCSDRRNDVKQKSTSGLNACPAWVRSQVTTALRAVQGYQSTTGKGLLRLRENRRF